MGPLTIAKIKAVAFGSHERYEKLDRDAAREVWPEIEALLKAAAACEDLGEETAEACECVREASADHLRALELISSYGGIDGAHHKQWVLDQVVRVLLGPCAYERWVIEQKAGEDGPNTYSWDGGIAP